MRVSPDRHVQAAKTRKGCATESRAAMAGSGERRTNAGRRALTAPAQSVRALVAGRLHVGHRFIGAPSPELRDDGAFQESSVTS
ncbi:hypothetical protein D9623_21830 [Azospirillum brasilense]|uniref:Uncharacterized protein n=1 Tax=Azospirillum brasilense TaxID=192 RepID=A0A4D8QL88_AZOBR|nr:hypothetical protein [Azospirillum brasilense]QCO11157.1 hypothetical protein D3868_19270 [Azospirillum brasilense]QEL92656.1 hypothetical protein D9621_21525 [Azospirillum brasilense]QEL98975.1 hypothetical protein D9623_21830 [Azospirillum brasilense]